MTNHDLKYVYGTTITDNGDFYFNGPMPDNSYKLYRVSDSNIANSNFEATELVSGSENFRDLTTDGTNVYYSKNINNTYPVCVYNSAFGGETVLPLPENVTNVQFLNRPYSRVTQFNGKIFTQLSGVGDSYYAFYDPSVTTPVTVYTTPTNRTAIVKNIQVTNESGSKIVKTSVTDSSTSTTYQVAYASITGPTICNVAKGPIILEEGDSISMETNTTTGAVTATVSILEISREDQNG